MKTIGKIFTMAIALFISNAVIASGLSVNLTSNEADFAVMEISNNKMSNFEIEVSEEYGENL